MRIRHQRTVCTLLTTLILVVNLIRAEPKKKRVIIHVPETVKHVHHHITKKVPLPIVVFTKTKEPKAHKEKETLYYHDAKDAYNEHNNLYNEHKNVYNEHKNVYNEHKDMYPSLTEEGYSTGYEAEYGGSENNFVSHGLKDLDIQMARGVVADYHEVKPKILKPKSVPPIVHLTPPRRSKATKPHPDQYWSENRDEFKSYSPPKYQPTQRPSHTSSHPPNHHHYFELGSLSDYRDTVSHASQVSHVYPTDSPLKKKMKKKVRVHKRRIPHSLDQRYERAAPTRATSYHVNEFIEEDFRR